MTEIVINIPKVFIKVDPPEYIGENLIIAYRYTDYKEIGEENCTLMEKILFKCDDGKILKAKISAETNSSYSDGILDVYEPKIYYSSEFNNCRDEFLLFMWNNTKSFLNEYCSSLFPPAEHAFFNCIADISKLDKKFILNDPERDDKVVEINSKNFWNKVEPFYSKFGGTMDLDCYNKNDICYLYVTPTESNPNKATFESSDEDPNFKSLFIIDVMATESALKNIKCEFELQDIKFTISFNHKI